MIFENIASTKYQINREIAQQILNFTKHKWTAQRYSNEIESIEQLFSADQQEITLEALAIAFDLITLDRKESVISDNSEDVSKTIEFLTNLFLGEIAEYAFEFNKLTALTILFMNGYRNLGINELSITERMIDNLYQQLDYNRTPGAEDLGILDFVFGSFYALVSADLYKYNIDFIARRRLLGQLIFKFFSFIGLEPEKWQTTLIDQAPKPYLFVTIISGLVEFVQMIIFHSYEIPLKAQVTKLLEMATNILSVIQNITMSYLLQNYNFPDPTLSIQNFIQKLQEPIDNKPFSIHVSDKISEILVISARYRLMLSSVSIQAALAPREIIFQLSIMETVDTLSETQDMLYFIDAMLYQQKYPFDDILQAIEREMAVSHSILKSSTFEEDIIKFLNDSIYYLIEKQKQSTNIDIESYEIITYFAGEWLQIFSKDINRYHEAITMFTGIIISCLVHIIRGYFEYNKIDKAFLSYLNLYYFSELMNKKMYSAAPLTSIRKTDEFFVSEIHKQFSEMTHNWNIEFYGNEANLKEIAAKIELSMISQHGESHSTLPYLFGPLDDTSVLEYVDLVDNLTIFLEIANKQPIALTLDQLSSFGIYQPSSSSAHFRFQRIGSEATARNIEELPFPLIRNIHTVAAAMANIPIDPNVVSIDIETIINSMSRYINVEKEFDEESI